jgi:hypothetical protein
MPGSGMIMILLLTGTALFALSRLKESFSTDLDYLEGAKSLEAELEEKMY